RLTGLVPVGEAEPPRVLVDLAPYSEASEPAGAQRLKHGEPCTETGLVCPLGAREERRVVEEPALVVDGVAVGDERCGLVAVDDPLALHVAGALDAEVLHPSDSEPPTGAGAIMRRGPDYLMRHWRAGRA